MKVSDQAKLYQEDKQSNTTDQGLDPSMVLLFVVYLFSPYLTYSILFEHALTLTLTLTLIVTLTLTLSLTLIESAILMTQVSVSHNIFSGLICI